MASVSVSPSNNGTSNSLSISWSASASGLSTSQTYDVLVSGPGLSPITATISSPASTGGSATATGLAASTSYSYTITLRGTNDGSLKASNSGSATTSAAPTYPPSWTDNTLSSDVTAGIAYSDAVSSTNMAYNGSYTVTSGALPAGITLNPSTGAVTGTPSVVGPYSFTITASNTYGSTSASYSWTINGGLYTYKSGAWAASPAYKYDGSQWVTGTVYKYDGSAWVIASY